MKKIIVGLVLFLTPFVAFGAGFEKDLRQGSENADVTALQIFLTAQSVYSGPITGYFGPLTLGGVKKFQVKQKISPVSGFFGPISRGIANKVLATVAGSTVVPSTPIIPSTQGNAVIPTTPAFDSTFGSPVTVPSPATTTIEVKDISTRPAYSDCGASPAESYTVAVLDQFNAPIPNQTVSYIGTAENNKEGSITTGDSGRVNFNYTAKGVADGVVSLTFSLANGMSTTTSFTITPAPTPKPAYCF